MNSTDGATAPKRKNDLKSCDLYKRIIDDSQAQHGVWPYHNDADSEVDRQRKKS